MFLTALVASGCGGGGGGGSSAGADAPAASNAPPSIQGQPGGRVVAGQSYSFQPSASDANGDQLSFTATNLPSWATLNASSGRLSGTPSAAQIGNYAGIVITVSDGRASASLGPFDITVTDRATGSATLSWTPPTQNSDGSTLMNLSGYQILFGRDMFSPSERVELTNPSLNRYVVENLGDGTWYFTIIAVTSTGAASNPSNIVSKTIT